MRCSPHLCFDGQCEAAFRVYHELLGGRLTTLLKYGESPMAGQVPAQYRDRIIHATLDLGDQELLGADVFPEDYRQPQGFFVTLGIEEYDRAKTVFEALAEGGQVRMPFQETFWSPGFGVVIDRFGIPWEIHREDAENPARIASFMSP